jgi:cytidylate kinase
MEREGLTEQRAAEKARKMDKLRRSYYDYYTDKSWGEASSYNLLIDTSVLGEEQTACFIRDFVLRAMEDRK